MVLASVLAQLLNLPLCHASAFIGRFLPTAVRALVDSRRVQAHLLANLARLLKTLLERRVAVLQLS